MCLYESINYWVEQSFNKFYEQLRLALVLTHLDLLSLGVLLKNLMSFCILCLDSKEKKSDFFNICACFLVAIENLMPYRS